MKNPHDKSEYVNMNDNAAEQAEPQNDEATPVAEQVVNNAESAEKNNEPEKSARKKKPKYSGAYYYVDKDEKTLATRSFVRTLLTTVAFLLQLVALIFPEQAGAMYVSKHIGSYGLLYVVFTVFGMFGVSIWLMVMNQIRYKITKRITAEHAPKKGFKNRAYFGQELYMAMLAVMAAFQLSFVCIRFDGWGLGAFFVCLASLGAAVAARQITHATLKDAELIHAPEGENN